MDKRLINLLKLLQLKCGVLIGQKSLDRLITFVDGYIYCTNEQENVHLNFLTGFQEYIEKYYDMHDNIHLFHNWSEIICFFNATEEEAFDAFYKHMNLFLKETIFDVEE